MRNLVLCTFLLLSVKLVSSQEIQPADRKKLQRSEDSLKNLAKAFSTDEEPASRMRADSFFIKTLVRSLKTKGSFYFPFDNVQGISKVYAPDSSFRVFTWMIQIDEDHSRKRGAIQVRTADGSLKLIPLKDITSFSAQPMDSIRTKDNWVGAVYYDVIKTEYKNRYYYTLLGIDNAGLRSTKKWIEVLSFDEKGEPFFGETGFSFKRDSVPVPDQFRFNLEYRKHAPVTLRFDSELNMIIFDELMPENGEKENRYSYIPGGYFEGFKWQDGKWLHVDNAVFTLILKNGEYPMPQPLKDKDGKNNEKMLWEQSVKNASTKKDGGKGKD